MTAVQSGLRRSMGAFDCLRSAEDHGLGGRQGQLGALSEVWPHMLAMMFEGKHVAIELRDPLTPLHRQLEVADGVADIGLDFAPEERRVLFGDIGRAGIS